MTLKKEVKIRVVENENEKYICIDIIIKKKQKKTEVRTNKHKRSLADNRDHPMTQK